MKLRDNRGKLDLTKIIDDNVSLVEELRAKLKSKCNEVLDLRKEIDRLSEERDNLLIVNKSHQELNGKLQEKINEFGRVIDRSIDDL